MPDFLCKPQGKLFFADLLHSPESPTFTDRSNAYEAAALVVMSVRVPPRSLRTTSSGWHSNGGGVTTSPRP